MLNRDFYSTAELAELWGVAPDKIGDLIRSGELVAHNLATRATGRPRWRISREAAEQFLSRRQSQPPAPRITRRRKVRPVKQYV